MTKVLKITGRLIGITLEWLLILVILLAFLIRTTPFQTFFAHKATEFLSNELNTTIRIDKLSIVFIDRVALEGVLVLDQHKDTLASIDRLFVTLDKLDLKNQKVDLAQAELDGGVIGINRDAKTGDYNYEFLVDYFDSGTKSTKKSKPFVVTLSSLKLNDIHFNYDDFRKSYNTFGMDYDHLKVSDLSLNADDIEVNDGIISLHIQEMKATEKCGFILDNLNSYVSISDEGLKFRYLTINTPYTDLHVSKLFLLVNGLDNLENARDSMQFDVRINTSKVSLKDVSYFATALEGMDQDVILRGDISHGVNDMRITNLDLQTGQKTRIKGTINLPDFRKIEAAFFNEKIDYAYISLNDLEKIKMPVDAGSGYLTFDTYLQRFGHFEAKDLRLDGFYSQFVIASDWIKTAIGTVKMDNGIMFSQNPKNHSLLFEKSGASDYDVKIENFELGKFLDDNSFGSVDGTFFLSGEAFSLNDIHFNLIEGNVNHFDYMSYPYENILITEGSFVDQLLLAKVDILDDNLNLTYDGSIDFNGDQHFKFNIDLKKAILDNLNITQKDSSSLTTNFTVDLTGSNANNIKGNIKLEGFIYKEGEKVVRVPDLTINVVRAEDKDELTVESSLADVRFSGKVDFSTLLSDFSEQFYHIFPSVIGQQKISKRKKRKPGYFEYAITTHDLSSLLAIFAPEVSIAPETKLSGNYDGAQSEFSLSLTSSHIDYNKFSLKNINMQQQINALELNADYQFGQFKYGDSVQLDQVHFTTRGQEQSLISEITWNPETSNNSDIKWETNIVNNTIALKIQPSFFSINEMRWDIQNESSLLLASKKVTISNFKLSRNDQYISLNGILADNDDDKLQFKVNDLNLKELSTFIGSEIRMDGMLNGWGFISNPYSNLTYLGDASIQQLFLNEQEVGDIFVQSGWNQNSNGIGFTGDLIYKTIQTFSFDGNYFLNRKEDNLDFNLVFNNTDIKFTNAFMDPEVVDNIRGLLNGSIQVKGTPDAPELKGSINLTDGNAKLALLGVNFGLSGKIYCDKYGFYTDNLPVTDEEGNTGSLIGSVYHTNFKNWNYDLQFDFENRILPYNPKVSGPRTVPMDKFLVMNTKYAEGSYYYGKAYATGTANIFGDDDNIEITVDANTKKGTIVKLPMYGTSDLDEENDMISFETYANNPDDTIKKLDLTGVDLNLNFHVTPDAEIDVLFSDNPDDKIWAKGSANLSMNVGSNGDLSMTGTYNIKEGEYNFILPPINQTFKLDEGGTISWAGDPYKATVKLSAYYATTASISDISPNQLDNNSITSSVQEIRSYINLNGEMMQPTIAFSIAAPKAEGNDKTLIERVNSPDELNRQFFSLLLWRKFQPLKGTISTGSSGALDLAEAKINELLSDFSKDYRMNVNMSNTDLAGSKYEVTISKNFMGDKLTVTGSFGVQNYTSSSQTQNSFIGDVSIEYKLNESGSFNVNIFNNSNDYSIIQNKNLGQFTQGIGITYQEEFDNLNNFKMVQYILDVFRKKENKKYPEKRKSSQVPVPPERPVDNTPAPTDPEPVSSVFTFPEKTNGLASIHSITISA